MIWINPDFIRLEGAKQNCTKYLRSYGGWQLEREAVAFYTQQAATGSVEARSETSLSRGVRTM